MEGEFEKRFDRQMLLKLAAAAGGAGLLAGRTGMADAMSSFASAETGRLQVMDWAGYGNDGGQSMFAQYVKQHAANKPRFTYMTNESDALAKIQAGQRPDILGEVLRAERPRAAVGPVAAEELQAAEPVHGEGGPVRR